MFVDSDDPPPAPELDPVELAVPKLFVPGAVAVGTLPALPAPLGSLTELFRLPGFAGPFGTPLIDAEPAPVEPAFGVPAALGLLAVGPLAAPEELAALDPPPADPPPADPPPPAPPPPPPLCPKVATGISITATRTNLGSEAMSIVLSFVPTTFRTVDRSYRDSCRKYLTA